MTYICPTLKYEVPTHFDLLNVCLWGIMKVFFVISALLVYVKGATIAPTQIIDSQCIRKDVTNGCSNPLAKFDPISQFVNKMFFYDCNRHDICYQCGHTLGINRTECDRIFLQNMKNTCKPLKRKRFLGFGQYVGNVLGAAADIAGNVLSKPVESLTNSISSGKLVKDPLGAAADLLLSPVHSAETLSCGMAAEIYYTAVRTAGNSHFDQKTHIECSEPWVNPCLPSRSQITVV